MNLLKYFNRCHVLNINLKNFLFFFFLFLQNLLIHSVWMKDISLHRAKDYNHVLKALVIVNMLYVSVTPEQINAFV